MFRYCFDNAKDFYYNAYKTIKKNIILFLNKSMYYIMLFVKVVLHIGKIKIKAIDVIDISL